MAYLVVKHRKGKPYLYEQRTFRQEGKVRTKNKYLGRLIDQQATIEKEGETAFLCERTTYRQKGELITRIDKVRPARPEEITAFQEKPSAEPKPQRNKLQIKGDLTRYLDPANLQREYYALFKHLGLTDSDILKLPAIRVKPGRRTASKKSLFGVHLVTFSRYTPGQAGKRGFYREFRRALARTGLEWMEKHHPGKYKKLARELKGSFKASKSALADYTRHTKDRQAAGKAAVIKRGFFKRAYKNPLKSLQLGRADEQVYHDWQDEFCSIIAEIQTKRDFENLYQRAKSEYYRAQHGHRQAAADLKETKIYHLAVIGERRRQLKRMEARLMATKEMI